MNKNSPAVQALLAEIKEDTKKSGEQCEIISFDEFWTDKYSADDTNFSITSFLGELSMLLVHNQVSYYKDLTSYRKGLSRLVFPVKRLIRKLVAFLFLPVVAEQNEINLNVARLFMNLRAYVNKGYNSKAELSIKEKEMEQQLRSQRDMINDMSLQINELTKKIEALEKGGAEN